MLPFNHGETVVSDVTVNVDTVPTVTVVAVAFGNGNGVIETLVLGILLEAAVLRGTVTTVPVERKTVVEFESGRGAVREVRL